MLADKTFTTNVVNRSITEHLKFHMTFCFMRNYRTSITLLSNEICPEVKLGDFNVIFAVITDLKSKLSGEQSHLQEKVFAFGRFTGAARQTTCNKKLIHPAVF